MESLQSIKEEIQTAQTALEVATEKLKELENAQKQKPKKSLIDSPVAGSGDDYFELYEEQKKKFSGKFRIKDEEHSRKVQEYLFSIGCKWTYSNSPKVMLLCYKYLYVQDSILDIGNYEITFAENKTQEYTLKETTTYSLEAIPATFPKIETIEILGKHYSKEDVEKAFSNLQEIVK